MKKFIAYLVKNNSLFTTWELKSGFLLTEARVKALRFLTALTAVRKEWE